MTGKQDPPADAPSKVNLRTSVPDSQPSPPDEPRAAIKHGLLSDLHKGELLPILLDSSPQHVFWKDTKSRYLGCNKHFADAAGLKQPEDIIGLTDHDLPWTKKEADFYRLCDERIIEYDRPEYNIIETQKRADGRQIWVRTNKIPLHDEQGAVIGILGTFEDMTEQIKTEERLRQYETIASTVDDLMAIVSPDYTYQAVNNAFCAAYARSREEIIGSDIREFVDAELFETQFRPNIDRALAGNVVQFEGWRTFPGSGKKYVDYTYYPIFNEVEKVIGLVAKIHDSSSTKRLENQLQQAQKMEAIGRLAGGIAHDFNNILSIINGYSDICLYEMSEDNPHRSRLEQISEAGSRAARLTQQLLGFSRKQIIQPQLLNLAEEIETLNRMLERLLGESIAIETRFDEQLWPVMMDRSQFEQIILNLAVNSRDAMEKGGCLTIEITNRKVSEDYQLDAYAVTAGDYVMLAFSDDGIGMTPEVQAKIFEPFFTTKPKEVGTGFGLSTVYGIVKQNEGYISVYSEVDTGTTFKLLFPRSLKAPAGPTPGTIDEAETPVRGSGTILLVEDDHALRTMCVAILKELGYTVLEAGNGKEAVESAKRFHGKIDLLLTDVVMPELSGPEAAVIIGDMHPGMRVLFMSGYTENAIVHHGVLDEGISFIQKPITPKILSQAIRNCLQASKKKRT